MSELKTPFKVKWIDHADVYEITEHPEYPDCYLVSCDGISSSYGKYTIHRQIEEGLMIVVRDDPVCTPEATPDVTTEEGNSKWTAAHYDNYYQLTEADIESGKVKIDAYFVNKMWKLNQKDDTGGLFHSLKTIARFGEKNTIERELKALYNQTKRMAELYGVQL